VCVVVRGFFCHTPECLRVYESSGILLSQLGRPAKLPSVWDVKREDRQQCATLKNMAEVGIRALKQNASAVVAQAAGGEPVIITDRGRAVAQLTAIPSSRLGQLIASGHARPPRRDIGALPSPEPGPKLTEELLTARNAERY